MEFIFVTGNANKVKEAEMILGVKLKSVDIKTPEIQTLDPIACAKEKAKSAFLVLQKPVLVEDVSLFFDAWNGLPGVFIDYFLKTLEVEGILKLLEPEKNRRAKACVTLCAYDGVNTYVGSGETVGQIAMKAEGENGFGWDKIFIPDGQIKTQAQMREEEKNAMSSRKLAYENLKKVLP